MTFETPYSFFIIYNKFDAQSISDGSFKLTSPAYMSRGGFAAEIAAPRLLRIFKKYGVSIT